ncbi:MAG: oxalate:formate antiporter [Ruminococcus sp.]|nr:oxalate:formate antiporter [Ruminococcus sp.]
MKNVSRIIPCYAADTSGVCSALYELGGMTVVHDASGCNSTYSTHDEPRWVDMKSNIYISALTELDAIMGNDEKLINDAVSAGHDKAPEFITVCGSPMPMMTGVDFDAVAHEIQSKSGIRTFPLHTNGTHSYINGASEAFLEIVREYAQPCDRVENGVNVLGLTPLDFPLGADKHIKKWLGDNGFECICTLAMGDSLENVKKMASAAVSLVVSYSGLAAAQLLKDRYGIPFVVGVPYGLEFPYDLAGAMLVSIESREDSFYCAAHGGSNDIVIIGESVSAASLACAIEADRNVKCSVLSPLPTDARILADGDSELYAEEDIERYISQRMPAAVIADPLYKYIVPKKVKFINLPHFAFSGRCYQKHMKNMICCDLKEILR